MVLNYKKSQSTVRPELVDASSSKTTVYLRQNIEEVITTVEDEEITYYEYDEAKLTKAEYEQYLKELDAIDVQQQSEDIEALKLENETLKEELFMLTQCILEMSELVYA